MNLYTVTIDFQDRTQAVEQVENSTEFGALHAVLREAEALESHQTEAIEETIQNYLRITHLAMGYKGAWIWHHCNFDNEKVEDIYGGFIVQTDKNGAIRERGT